MLGTGLVVGVALDSSQSSPPTPPVAVANSQQDKKATAATPRAVDATTAFLEALDAKQRG